MRQRFAPKTPIAIAAAAALALAGCGGGGSSTTSGGVTLTGAGGATTTIDTTKLSPQQQKRLEQLRQKAGQLKKKAEEKARGSGSGGGNSAEVPFKQPSGSTPTGAAALPNQGTKRVAPGVPTAKGGDNSIQEYGVEGPSSDRVRAARVLQAYLNARVEHQWGVACSYMTAAIRQQLAQLASQGGKGGSLDCAEAMRGLTAGVPEKALRSAADIDVLSMRIQGGRSFLIYKDGAGTPTAMPMGREGGAWKVGAIAGSPLLL